MASMVDGVITVPGSTLSRMLGLPRITGLPAMGLMASHILDGAQMPTKSGFLCVLGEAVNGPGGYFGSNLYALADGISASFREGPPVKIVWRYFRVSQNSLDRAFVNSVIEVMSEFNVDVAIC